MRGTVSDFWAMAVQEDVGQILMLCETVENGIEKCHQVSLGPYNNYSVTLLFSTGRRKSTARWTSAASS